MTQNKKKALLSVWDKTGIVPFAVGLQEVGFEILSTEGTAKELRSAKVPVTEISSYTGSPEILEGRVKSLHPKIFAGILAKKEDPNHVEDLSREGFSSIELVVVNFYPFEEGAAAAEQKSLGKEGRFDAMAEYIDIGGPSMVRAAAKNCLRTIVVIDPADYPFILSALRAGNLDLEMRFKLSVKAFELTSYYDAAIAKQLCSFAPVSGAPKFFSLSGKLCQELRYGENPHQQSAAYFSAHSGASILKAKQMNGEALSYNNILDSDAALKLVRNLSGSSCVIIKHTNPCGVAEAKSLQEAFVKALQCDEKSAFGGIVAFNQYLEEDLAKILAERFFEVILVPGLSKRAEVLLASRPKLKVLVLGEEAALPKKSRGQVVRSVEGGFLVQEEDLGPVIQEEWNIVSHKQPTEEEQADLLFAMKVAANVSSNAIVLAKDRAAIGIGAGQMSRVDAVEIALRKTKGSLSGTILASDAFFPFRDSVDLAAQAGISAIIQPGGSKRDAEVIAAADEHNISLIFTGVRHFRH